MEALVEPVNWRRHIVTDEKVLAGKPIVRGTRLSVEFVLELLAGGWSREDLRANYPRLSDDDVRAVLDYAARA